MDRKPALGLDAHQAPAPTAATSPATRATGGSPEPPAPASAMPAALREARPHPEVVLVPARTVLALDGHGGSDEPAFHDAVAALLAVEGALRSERARRGPEQAFGPAPLEARFWTDDGVRSIAEAPPSAWRWRLRSAVPDAVEDEEVAAAIAAALPGLQGRAAPASAAARVRRERVAARRYGRVLHAGPRAAASARLEEIRELLEAAHLSEVTSHLEVYLGDPRTTPPGDLLVGIFLELTR